jgi:ABC-type antimicrobial peptide transport system permease subunit
LLTGILGEGAVMAGTGVVAGAIGGIALARFAAGYIADVHAPGLLPLLGASTLLVVAAVVASVMPAARAARVDVMQALRSE